MKAIIPAAGLGTRFLPGTKTIPKEMLLVLDKPVIQYIVEEALSAGCDEVVIVNNREKEAIESHFAPAPELINVLRKRGKDEYAEEVEHISDLPVSFVYQDEPLGLGHAVHCGACKTGIDSFMVLLGDTIAPGNDIIPKMLEISREHNGASVLVALPVNPSDVGRFGIIDGLEVSPGVLKVHSVVEKPAPDKAPSNYSIFGRYLLSSRVMKLLEGVAPGVGGEIQLTDAILAALKEEAFYALVIESDQVFDTGTVESWINTNAVMLQRLKAKREWQ